MALYRVHCADRKSGRDLVAEVQAANKNDALEFASAQGLLVSRCELAPPAHPSGDPAPVHIPGLSTIGGELAAVNQRLDKLLRSGIIRAPVGTITTAAIVALILAMAIGFAAAFFLAALATQHVR